MSEEDRNNNAKYMREIAYILGDDKKKLPLLIILFLIAGVVDVLGLGIAVPFVAYLINPETASYASNFTFIDLTNSEASQNEILFMLSLFMFIAFLLKAIVGISTQYFIINYSNQKMKELRSFLMRAYLGMSYERIIQRNSSEYIYAMQSLTAIYANRVLLPMLRVVSDIIVCLFIFTFLFIYAGNLLFVIIVILLSVVLCYDKIFKKTLIELGRRQNQASSLLIKGLSEAIYGLREIRTFDVERYFFSRVLRSAELVASSNTKSQTVSIAPRYVIEVTIIGLLVSFILITLLLDRDPSTIMPTLTIFVFSAVRAAPAINSILTNIIALRNNRNSVALLYRDLSGLEQNKIQRIPFKSNHLKDVFESLEFNNMCFTYPGNDEPTLIDVSFTLRKGEIIGIIGESGSGKSTLVNVMAGFFPVTSGKISINGKISVDNKLSWAGNVAYLPQEIFLIDATLRENIALGCDNENIDNERVMASITKARLQSMIAELPLGLDTIIGDRGVKLSGGQRQRIALARAFYYDRKVLILDEATSALDENTEREIIEEILDLDEDTTIIIITHRLTTLKNVDRVLKIENGMMFSFNIKNDL